MIGVADPISCTGLPEPLGKMDSPSEPGVEVRSRPVPAPPTYPALPDPRGDDDPARTPTRGSALKSPEIKELPYAAPEKPMVFTPGPGVSEEKSIVWSNWPPQTETKAEAKTAVGRILPIGHRRFRRNRIVDVFISKRICSLCDVFGPLNRAISCIYCADVGE